MPLQNRVLPTGEIAAIEARGTLTGNRGILDFDATGRLGTARWRSQAWISCTLIHPRGKYQGPRPVRSWTPLFFLDEAVALAAGHRPCAYCRRAAFAAYRDAWARATGAAPRAPAIDRALHRARATRDRRQVRLTAVAADLPPGAMVLWQDRPHLVAADALRPWHPAGYDAPVPRPDGPVTVLTPAPSLAALAAGFRPELHQSATA
ncbi:hypothetical protein [Pseudooceanicola sp. LIPI14-2-Ac024]|uniref:hypothetical protein n=1 Tax=Pseudooceanicola sp. LIPI14-2-Ac024 TaxID=3344875 RepID=UPI0035CFF03E